MRNAGILMSISSLPSYYGIGDLGLNAYTFVDDIKKANIQTWQILPFNRLGFGNSPYQCYSSIAGDEIFIGFDLLIADGLLSDNDVTYLNENSEFIDYQKVRDFKNIILRKAYHNFKKWENHTELLETFKEDNEWVYNYAVFVSLKASNEQRSWVEWPSEQKNWINDKGFDLSPYVDEINYYIFLQYIFYQQWYQLKAYTNDKGIEIMGDIPYYVGIDSLDVWENQKLFLLDEKGNPTSVAGVPPDYFAQTGQRWGNPIYNWDKIKEDNYQFWINRLALNAKAFDIIRIDHFRAFDTYWKIPASCPTAIEGEWIEAPGYEFFDVLYKALPDLRLIAEDLGEMRPEVFALRDHYQLAGMKIIQFTFDPNENNNNFDDKENMIVYTGTHDNQTILGWYLKQEEKTKLAIDQFFKDNDYTEDFVTNMVQYSLDNIAYLCVIPTQDLLGLDDYARMNIPGSVGSPNWEWKLADYRLLKPALVKYAKMITKSKRN